MQSILGQVTNKCVDNDDTLHPAAKVKKCTLEKLYPQTAPQSPTQYFARQGVVPQRATEHD